MTLYYLNIDITASVVRSGFKVSFYDDYRSDFRFCCEVEGSMPEFSAGGEVRLLDNNGETVWGGIAESIELIHRSNGRARAEFFCRGYEQVTQRRLVSDFISVQTSTGAVAQHFFAKFLGPVTGTDNTQEGLLSAADSFDTGVSLNNYGHLSAPADVILDDIAGSAGFRWWITPSKVFYMKSSITITDSGLSVDTDVHNPEVISLRLIKDLRYYRNEQSVFGANSSSASLNDQDEITRMKALFGTGKYSSSVSNSMILNNADCRQTAQNLLNCYCHEPIYLKIKTTYQGLKLYTRIYLKGGLYGLPAYVPYVITELSARYTGAELEYEAKALRYDGSSIRPRPYRISRGASIW